MPCIGGIRAAETGTSSAADTLQALGLLVEKNKNTNSALAVKYARKALTLAWQTKRPNDRVDAYKWIGKAYLQGFKDSSYFYFDLALRLADSAKLVKQKGQIYYNLASLYIAAYNYQTAISLVDSAIAFASAVEDYEGLTNGFIALGNLKTNIHDYESAKNLYDSALSVARKHSLYKQMGVATGNLARSPFEKEVRKKFALQREALFYLNKAKGAEEEMSYIFHNMGAQSANPDSALFYYKLALNLAIRANLPKVMFAAYNNMAYSYLDKKDLARAEECLRDQAIPKAKEVKDNDWLASLYDTYADICMEKGDYRTGLEMQKNAMRARDADYRQKAADQVRLLAALLELKNKELIIEQEEKEILLQRNRLQQVELWLVIALLLVVGSVFTTLVLQQRTRARFQRELLVSARRLIDMEETEKGRTARELHDLTGQLMLGVSGALENVDFPDPSVKEQVKGRIKELGASMRKISHKMNRNMIEHFTFDEMVTGLCEDVQKLSGMKIDARVDDEFPDLPKDLVLHFYRILQELLTNAGKYAKESVVSIRVSLRHGKIVLHYSDNGPGFIYDDKGRQSMGIMNIFERAKIVGGKATLHSAPGKGTTWEIVFPLGKTVAV